MLADYFLYFIIYSFIGWLWEGIISLIRDHKIVNRGFLIGPYCPIYGCGALIFIALSFFIHDPVTMFFLGGLFACILEYATSFVMEKLFNARWWDYSDKFMNINGRVYLLGYIVFGAGAVAILYLHPYLAELIAKLDGRNTIAIILAALFMLDIVSTNQSIARFNKILREYQNILKRGKIVQFFERNGHRFIQTINNRTRRIFTWQQRRILRAFPNFQTNYDKAFAELQKFYKKTKYKPAKTQKANARKKSKKILK